MKLLLMLRKLKTTVEGYTHFISNDNISSHISNVCLNNSSTIIFDQNSKNHSFSYQASDTLIAQIESKAMKITSFIPPDSYSYSSLTVI